MKHRILIWVLALALSVSLAVPVLADNTVVHDGDKTIITDENGNTIIVEEVDESDENGTVTFHSPSPSATPKPGATPAPQPSATPTNGSGSDGSGKTEPSDDPAADTSAAPESPAPDGAETAADPANGAQAAASKDGAQSNASAGKNAGSTPYVLMAILAAIILACAGYLFVIRKKK